ncbi:TIM barrel protein [Methanobacterium paludis]|uniref:Xylose isomerase domain-containing protein TIM barrel n=1 Tax=Methanobacterium paludis (strain DSM 25820 / JCM 18151 / SWAN1) TaxID=868131 RepID=F6D1L5_METPW|nr:TIM barrel protein [Methanobacterium paludis]AEG17243.1 Xylose isomerase domain-containing protein TIM barrel [Methanobacterium paludis]
MAVVRFGPAGKPIDYKGKTNDVCTYINAERLDAYEYQATYGVKISKQSAIELKKNSKDNDVLVSMHAPYYINLSSNKADVIERSVKRLVQAAKASEWMGAYRTVFHPGFYTTYTPEEAMKCCKKAITEIQDELEAQSVNEYTFAPETTGKKSQLGNLDEIIEICGSFEHFAPTVDFAHVHARSGGSIKDKNAYNKIFQKLEDELGLKSLHSHFTRIEYTDAGERKHHTLAEDSYGPPLEPLLEEIVDCGWDVTVICETPFLDHDAIKMKVLYEDILKIK